MRKHIFGAAVLTPPNHSVKQSIACSSFLRRRKILIATRTRQRCSVGIRGFRLAYKSAYIYVFLSTRTTLSGAKCTLKKIRDQKQADHNSKFNFRVKFRSVVIKILTISLQGSRLDGLKTKIYRPSHLGAECVGVIASLGFLIVQNN